MAQMNKDFAETLLKRVESGKHINTTVWEEEQLIRGWLWWYENYYKPRLKEIVSKDPLINLTGVVIGMDDNSLGRTDAASSGNKEKP